MSDQLNQDIEKSLPAQVTSALQTRLKLDVEHGNGGGRMTERATILAFLQQALAECITSPVSDYKLRQLVDRLYPPKERIEPDPLLSYSWRVHNGALEFRYDSTVGKWVTFSPKAEVFFPLPAERITLWADLFAKPFE